MWAVLADLAELMHCLSRTFDGLRDVTVGIVCNSRKGGTYFSLEHASHKTQLLARTLASGGSGQPKS
jgi:hypothetical protein